MRSALPPVGPRGGAVARHQAAACFVVQVRATVDGIADCVRGRTWRPSPDPSLSRSATTSLAARRRFALLVVVSRRRRSVSLRHELFEMRVNLVFGPGDAPGAEFNRSRELARLHQPAEMVAAVGDAFLSLKFGKSQEPHRTSPRNAIWGDAIGCTEVRLFLNVSCSEFVSNSGQGNSRPYRNEFGTVRNYRHKLGVDLSITENLFQSCPDGGSAAIKFLL